MATRQAAVLTLQTQAGGSLEGAALELLARTGRLAGRDLQRARAEAGAKQTEQTK